MTFAEMKTGVPYIVTRESDDGSFQIGEKIRRLATGEVVNDQTWWPSKHNPSRAVIGMECEVDRHRIQQRKEKLLRRLAELELLDEWLDKLDSLLTDGYEQQP